MFQLSSDLYEKIRVHGDPKGFELSGVWIIWIILTVYSRSGFSVNSGYVKAAIFPDFVENVPEFSPISLWYFPILCKLDNSTLWNHNFHMVCICAPNKSKHKGSSYQVIFIAVQEVPNKFVCI